MEKGREKEKEIEKIPAYYTRIYITNYATLVEEEVRASHFLKLI
jgi:hypothetical protein